MTRWRMLAGGAAIAGAAGLALFRSSPVEQEAPLEADDVREVLTAASTGDESAIDFYRVGSTPRDPIGRVPADVGEESKSGFYGQVLGPDGAPVTRRTVYARLPDSKARPSAICFGEAPIDSDGRYDLRLPGHVDSYAVDLGVVAPGFLRALEKDVPVSRESRAKDFSLSGGEAVSGFVSTVDGEPVAGVELLVTRTKRVNRQPSFVSSALLDTRAHRLARRTSDYHESVCMTGEDGEFVASGLAPGPYFVVSRSPSHIWQAEPVTAGQKDVYIFAEEPCGVRIKAFDATDGRVLDRPSVGMAVIEQREDGRTIRRRVSGQGRNGEAILAWGPRAPHGEFKVAVSYPGYVDQKLSLQFQGSGLVEAEVRLEPLELQPVQLNIWTDDGQPYTKQVLFEYAASKDPGSRMSTISRPDGGFRHFVDAPPGSWFVRVRRATDITTYGAWSGELDIPDSSSDGSTVLLADVTLKIGAAVIVDLVTPLQDRESSVTLESGSFIGRQRLSEGDREFTGLPPGEWQITVDGRPTQTVTLRGGDRTALQF